MKFIRHDNDDKLIDAISEREHLINLLLKDKDKLPINCTINELLCPSGVSINDYQDAIKQVDKYINEIKKKK